MEISFSKRILKVENVLPKHHLFFFILGIVLQIENEAKDDVESIWARVTKLASKKMSKAEVNLKLL